jgi:uncharacterized protein YodC (DUF2158 family)
LGETPEESKGLLTTSKIRTIKTSSALNSKTLKLWTVKGFSHNQRNNMKQWKIKDVVRHVSGSGPKMVVTGMRPGKDTELVTVEWWDEEKKIFMHQDLRSDVLMTENPNSDR